MNKLPRYTSNSLKPHPQPGFKWGLDIKPGLPTTVLGETYCLCAVDFGSEIHCFQTDDEAIFVGGAFPAFCVEKNIVLQSSSPYIKEQNGLVESAIKTDFATSRTMIFNAGNSFDYRSKLGILLGMAPNKKDCYLIGQLRLPFKVVERSDVIVLETIPNSNPLLDPEIISEDSDTLMDIPPEPMKLVYSPLPTTSKVILAEKKAFINLM
eukprot:gene38433-50461_t